jgi:TIR domain
VEHDVFISYSVEDKPTADAVCAGLERDGVRCWIAPRDILPSQSWAEAIVEGIADSRLLIVIFSSASNASPQVLREVERAVSKAIPILPFRIEDVLPTRSLEYFLATPHWLDAITPPLERHIQKMVATVKVLLAADERNEPLPPVVEVVDAVELEEHPPDNWVEPKSRLGRLFKKMLEDR